LGLDHSFFDKTFQQRIHGKPKLRSPSSAEIVVVKIIKGELIKTTRTYKLITVRLAILKKTVGNQW
jgi:hypothetical protein